MTDFSDLLEQFAQTVHQGIPLAEAALLIARSEYPELNSNTYLSKLDALAFELSPVLGSEKDPLYCTNILSQFLFDDLGFRGNERDYYNPRNSYLSDALDRRTGIPITLSLVYIEVGARLGIPLLGIGMPGHFLVRHRDVADLYIDPFHGGILLSEKECEQRLHDVTGYSGPWSSVYLQPVSNREFIARMLGNLQQIYLNRQDMERARKVHEFLAVLG